MDLDKRSDIFWIKGSRVDPESVIIYYENPYMMMRHDDNQTAKKFFKDAGIKQVKLWKLKSSDTKYLYKNMIAKLKLLNHSNSIENQITHSEIILGMPEDSKERHFESLRFGIDNKVDLLLLH